MPSSNRSSISSQMFLPRSENSDRTDYVPRHVGPNVFPNFSLFSRLVRLSHKQHLIAVKDLTYDIEASYAQFLTDVLHLRDHLLDVLPSVVLRQIDEGREVYVTLVGPAGYEFTVGFFALMALGAAIVPISAELPVKEAVYFVAKSHAVAILSASRSMKLATDLEVLICETSQPTFTAVEIRPYILQSPLDPSQFQVSSDRYLDINSPGLVIFTSGTTGRPKGVVKRRNFFHDVATIFADQYGVGEGDTVLHTLPVHHTTGLAVTLLPFLQSGGCIEFRSGGFDPEWTWERFRRGGVAFYSGVPTIYLRLMQRYEQHLLKLPKDILAEYVKGAAELTALCGTSALPRPLQQKWTSLRGGRPILTRYGGTEFGTGFMVTPWSRGIPDGSVGVKAPGIDLKLSDGDEGEILVKSIVMFSKYLHDPEATRSAHDENGYFRTGDIARREGEFYFILGRASVDIIKSGGYKISALEIEREILGLEYIAETMVVGVEDEEFGQRVAAAVVLETDKPQALSLEKLRRDLRGTLTGYKMPTMLRVVPELKKNATGKVMKKTLGKETFPREGHPDVQVQVWHSKKTGPKL